jgi:hypothetical protein
VLLATMQYIDYYSVQYMLTCYGYALCLSSQLLILLFTITTATIAIGRCLSGTQRY